MLTWWQPARPATVGTNHPPPFNPTTSRLSDELPELAARGAFAPEAVYTAADIKEVGRAW